MVVTRHEITPPHKAGATVEPDALGALLRIIGPTPHGVPSDLWQAALVGPISEFLARPGKRFRGKLVELSWQIAGRTDPPPAHLALVVELLHAGSLIVDDIEDNSAQRRGRAALHRLVGLPLALNAGNWLYFWALSLLAEIGFSCRVERDLYRRATEAIRRCHEGQALDLAARVGDLHPSDIPGVAYTISSWKTGSLMALAASFGAVAAGADDGTVEALERFGERLGVGLQMQNDLAELTGAAGPLKQPEDFLHGRVTWPWAWASLRLPAARFDALQARGAQLASGIGDAAELARDLLDALGPDPVRPVREWLSRAFADLSAVVQAGPPLDDLRAEIRRLEEQYA